ncbi:MAG TPA: hypothetical protein VEM40_12725 [Nitrospirota bacterium]|nr:hypothetical protein [Nitrospirota bacterium]
MWKTIGGFVVSNFAEVFVKELVKEVTKANKPAPQQQRNTASVSKPTKNDPQQPIAFAKGQVMVLEWVPTSKQETNDQDTEQETGPSAGG